MELYGLVTKSSAPASIALSFSSSLSSAVTMTTGMKRVSGRGLERPAQRQAVHARHLDVDQRQVERRAALERDLERRLPVGGGDDLRAGAGQVGAQQVAVEPVVVHDQDAWRPVEDGDQIHESVVASPRCASVDLAGGDGHLDLADGLGDLDVARAGLVQLKMSWQRHTPIRSFSTPGVRSPPGRGCRR